MDYDTNPSVDVGQGRFLEDQQPPPLPTADFDAASDPLTVVPLPVSQVEAHLYSECARIWNPIHTDRAAALAAGLPDIILHGTATLAKAVSWIIDEYAVRPQPSMGPRPPAHHP